MQVVGTWIAAAAAAQPHTFAEHRVDDPNRVGAAASVEPGPGARSELVEHAKRARHVNLRTVLGCEPEGSLGNLPAWFAGACEEGTARIRFHDGAMMHRHAPTFAAVRRRVT